MTPTSFQITHTTSIRQLQNFLYDNSNAKLHGKLNRDGSYSLYVSKGGGSGASHLLRCSKDYRQMNARAAVLRVIANYEKDPIKQEEFANHFNEFEEYLIAKFPENEKDDLDAKTIQHVNDLEKYLILGLPSDIFNKPRGILTRYFLYAKDVSSRREPDLAWYLSDEDSIDEQS